MLLFSADQHNTGSAVSIVREKSPVTVRLFSALRTTDKPTDTLEWFEHWYTTLPATVHKCVYVCVRILMERSEWEEERGRQETNKSLSAPSAVGNKTILIL